MHCSRNNGWNLLLACGWLLVGGVGGASGGTIPLPAIPVGVTPQAAAHAHNDYEHVRPLWDALDQGFGSVEADIHLVNGKLLVAHDLQDVRPDRTLERLYLDPLAGRVRANGGRVYSLPTPFTLMIDIKSEPEATYRVLQRLLHRYRWMLTRFTDQDTRRGAVTVILSGERPIAAVQRQKERWCGIDGRLSDLELNPSRHLYPWVSDNWGPNFTWRGQGKIPADDLTKLRSLVAQAHAQGRRIRFWGTADEPSGWQVLREAGVDLLNADDLAGLRRFLDRSERRRAP